MKKTNPVNCYQCVYYNDCRNAYYGSSGCKMVKENKKKETL